jgi:hypothetical protein
MVGRDHFAKFHVLLFSARARETAPEAGALPIPAFEFGFKKALAFQTPRSHAGPDRRWNCLWELLSRV